MWQTLAHNGVTFPPSYEPHGVKMLYNGVPVNLSPAEEEARRAAPRPPPNSAPLTLAHHRRPRCLRA